MYILFYHIILYIVYTHYSWLWNRLKHDSHLLRSLVINQALLSFSDLEQNILSRTSILQHCIHFFSIDIPAVAGEPVSIRESKLSESSVAQSLVTFLHTFVDAKRMTLKQVWLISLALETNSWVLPQKLISRRNPCTSLHYSGRTEQFWELELILLDLALFRSENRWQWVATGEQLSVSIVISAWDAVRRSGNSFDLWPAPWRRISQLLIVSVLCCC